MTRALLERCRKFCQTAITYSPGQSSEKDAIVEALRKELAKPEQPAHTEAEVQQLSLIHI